MSDLETRKAELEGVIANAQKDLAVINKKLGIIPTRQKNVVNKTTDFAEKILKRKGDLHLNDLMDQMRKIGWISRGDNRADLKSAFECLRTNKKFANRGKNVWGMA